MSGIYILKTLDGYRVAYSKLKDYLFCNYNDDTMNYEIHTEVLNEIFGNCIFVKFE